MGLTVLKNVIARKTMSAIRNSVFAQMDCVIQTGREMDVANVSLLYVDVFLCLAVIHFENYYHNTAIGLFNSVERRGIN